MNKKELINQSINYILEHLHEDITIGEIADHFYFSKYYFCRIFKEVTGESIYSFIKRLKIDQSAVDIKLKKQRMITDIGLDYGYSSSNYSSAFKEHYQVSPVQFRKLSSVTTISNPFHPQKFENFNTYEDYDSKISIQELSDTLVTYERIIGNYVELKERWFRFIDKHKAYMNENTIMIEKFYNDPVITNLDRCICDLCITVDGNIDIDHMTTIKGGTFATYRYEGEIQDIFCTLQGIFSIWLSKSGYEMDERYGLNLYREMNRDNGRVIMDLCIPIK